MNALLACLLALVACDRESKTEKAPKAGPPPSEEDGPGPVGGDGEPLQAQFEVAEGEGVVIAGTVSLAEGLDEGPISLEFLANAGTTAPPMLLHRQKLDGAGAFSVEVPKGLGAVDILAVLDPAGDGPGPTEPQGDLHIEVGNDAMEGLVVTIEPLSDKGGEPPMKAEGEPPDQQDPGGKKPQK